MKEPTKDEIAKVVIALIELESAYLKGWKIDNKTATLINVLIEEMKYYYQFAPKH